VGIACTGENAIYESEAQCQAVCEHFPPGEFTDKVENTRGCRIYHSHNSLCLPAQHCSHAAIGGDGHCGALDGGNCESYCQMAQSICGTEFGDAFADTDACLEECAELDGQAGDSKYFVRVGEMGGNNLHCRFLALSRAALDDAECPAAFGEAPCAD
jgi:hypothetical protein